MPKRGRPLGTRNTELTRTKIQTTKILQRLTHHIMGTLKNDMTGEKMLLEPSQVTAALGLLKKVLPDLSSTNVQGDVFNYHYVVDTKPLTEDEWANSYEDRLATTDRSSESTH